MKPDERIYRLMLESEKVAPSQVLFIDDDPLQQDWYLLDEVNIC